MIPLIAKHLYTNNAFENSATQRRISEIKNAEDRLVKVKTSITSFTQNGINCFHYSKKKRNFLKQSQKFIKPIKIDRKTAIILTVDDKISCGQHCSKNDLHTMSS